MSSWVGHPNPQFFPPGTTVHLYPKPATPWSETGTPPGSETTSAAVSNEGVLTFSGLTEGSSYVGYVPTPDRYLNIRVDAATSGSGSVTSVNGKEGAVTLVAADVEAVGTASPAFTGTPTAPTATPGTSTTQLATTAFVAAIDVLAAKKASNLSDLASAATARTNLGLGTAATLASSAVVQTANNLSDVTAATARTNLGLGTSSTLSSAAVAQTANNLSDLANAGTARTNLGLGTASTLASSAVAQTANNLSDVASASTARTNLGLGSVATKSLPEVKAATRQILRRTVAVPAGQVPGNEVILDEYVSIAAEETRKIVWFECHTTSGTIKVKVGRGEAGETEISELNALEATSSIKLKTGLTISLSDKDRLRITLSSGSTPKGLFISWGEEVVAP
jgi:hypothetical protein